MKVGFLLPRYGAEALGGAELAARALAERLALRPGVACEVFTTCARDAATWRDELPVGTTTEGGVTVHRHTSAHGRTAEFARRNEAVVRDPSAVPVPDAWRWLEALGPVCPDAVDAAVSSSCDVVTVHPYLYHPCVTGVRALGRRGLLHPATHDEPAIHLPIYRDVFAAPGALAFWTQEERALAARLFPETVTARSLVVGFGVDSQEPIGPVPDAVAGRRFVLCLGKVLAAKGCHALARWFRAYAGRRGADVALVFAGPVVDPIDAIDPMEATGGGAGDVIVLGAVDEATKHALLARCEVLVSPSPIESLSLVVLEAWAAGRPVLVNGACDVTRGHCTRHGGGLWFVDYGTFEAALDRLLADHDLAAALGGAGRRAVAEHFAWPHVIDRYLAFLALLA